MGKKNFKIIVLVLVMTFNSFCIRNYKITEGVHVYAIADYFHSGILIHEKLSNGKNKYTHYTFFDVDWYIKGNTELSNIFPTLFKDTQGALEKAIYIGDKSLIDVISDLNYAQTPDGWLFPILEEKYKKGINYINTEVIGNKGELIKSYKYKNFNFYYYQTEKPYKLFYTCLHFTAYVLQMMGVDIKASWYIYTNDILRRRLNKLTSEIVFKRYVY